MFRKLLLVAMFGMVLWVAATAAQDPTKQDPLKQPEVKPDEPASIEVYRLKNADLNDALQAFQSLVSRTRRLSTAGPGVRGKGIAARGGGGGGGPGFPGGPGGGNPFPADFDAAYDPRPLTPTARALADPRTRSLIVRGTKKDQQLAADLVAILDTPEGKPLPAVKGVQAFRLQHLDANDLVSMLQTLDPQMTYHLAPIARLKLLLATGTDEQMKEVADAVKKLDIPGETK